MTLFTVQDPAIPQPDPLAADFALAQRCAPVLCVDRREPALPVAMGYSVIQAHGPSPSSKFMITPPVGGAVIEHAIWHDWVLQHLYDLDHVWVHFTAEGTPMRMEGVMRNMRVAADMGSGLPEGCHD